MTLEKGFVEPRYPSLPNLMKAKKKPKLKMFVNSLASILKIKSVAWIRMNFKT